MYFENYQEMDINTGMDFFGLSLPERLELNGISLEEFYKDESGMNEDIDKFYQFIELLNNNNFKIENSYTLSISSFCQDEVEKTLFNHQDRYDYVIRDDMIEVFDDITETYFEIRYSNEC